jgi:dephospho-CoA kinase
MKIGLTGGIASGKSTVAAILRELGAVIIDSDALARDVVAKGTPGLAQVAAAFGEGVLTPAGELNRPALAEIVFNDPDQRKILEAITHPLIGAAGAEIEQRARAEGHMVINDIPLLVEVGAADSFDAVIVVDASPDHQLERMVRDRGWSQEEGRARMANQASREQRLAVATYVIDNTGTLEELHEQVREVYADLVERLAARAGTAT